MLIGICGKSGSGKSFVAKEIVETYENAVHYDIDKLGHEILTLDEVKEELIKAFGPDIVKDNLVDRSMLSDIVFNSKEKMQILTDISWKHMEEELDKVVSESKDNIVVLDWILLTQTKFFEMCDVKILVDTPYDIRKTRAMNRDNITSEKFDTREKASIEYNDDEFDIVIDNNNIDKIRKMVKQL